MRIGLTGANGFLGFHLRSQLQARFGDAAVLIGREQFENTAAMDEALSQIDAVVHLAGVNRDPDPSRIEAANVGLAAQLVAGLERSNLSIPVVFGNSIHAGTDSAFGRSKAQAAEILGSWGDANDARVVDVRLPNIFGEYGRPFYNSFVATFCHQLAAGETPKIDVDREVPLLHAQRAVGLLIDSAVGSTAGVVEPAGESMKVSQTLALLEEMADDYRTGVLPRLSDPFTRDLFNTYRSFTFPHAWPIFPEGAVDERGALIEAVKSPGSGCQVFYSSTVPGHTRGNHFHLRKFERFMVLRGTAVIRLRKLFTDEVVEFRVEGGRPSIIDMPTMWLHSIENAGTDELLTLFFADEPFDADNPDTYWEDVIK